ncbi:MAG: hypothetical protein NT166_27865 [Candidatus Aminicenantes bacterium]|nr:hypothetical protein [Candidatus Aminicenantes bacterium]
MSKLKKDDKMSSLALEKKRKEMKQEFLALTPLERIRRMNTVFNDIIALKAKTKGVKEYEIYRSYLKDRR